MTSYDDKSTDPPEEVVSKANRHMVGGSHYHAHGRALQHWDVVRIFDLDYFQGQITRYLFRWRDKSGIEDLRKAAHYLEKYIEVAMEEDRAAGVETYSTVEEKIGEPQSRGYVCQDPDLRSKVSER